MNNTYENIIEEYYLIIKNKISQSRFDSALENIEKLLHNFPNNSKGYYYKAVCEFAKSQYQESIGDYINAIKLNLGYGEAYFNLGVTYFVLKYYDAALINIAKALIIFSKIQELDKKQRCIDALERIQMERNLS